MNRLVAVQPHGQSLWFDYIQRGLLWSGELQRMVREDGLRGLTSNPAIFEKAIGHTADYLPAVRALVRQGLGAEEIFERLAIEDLQNAADVLLPVYQSSAKVDGYVSLEVSPYLAADTAATLAEARRLWRAVQRARKAARARGREGDRQGGTRRAALFTHARHPHSLSRSRRRDVDARAKGGHIRTARAAPARPRPPPPIAAAPRRRLSPPHPPNFSASCAISGGCSKTRPPASMRPPRPTTS